ncbi:putative estradiol 17 beta-dehydrogenase [Mollisia scopiformis]|uniref:Putative estradiol 17 beta-dehydrogenase n=1 Tax=Mollisia scopiformis TaxID=149040 RepID=A0A194X6R0_MOLSC|nr:putative estradiol 17 beta-dehydrogenase [Mollisia scopiformis]KUJ15487.1 putative estradiol 17 beta-dehydrogenase [Mollisia scopiformis]
MPPSTPFKSAWTQFFPPKATFTDKNVTADLKGKVYIVTGANSGMGQDLARVLYAKNAKVYIACRSEEKATESISYIKKSAPTSKGELVFLPLDLADLAKVKAAAQRFLAQESRLHVLFNNAGVMTGPAEPPPKTVQGHELALGVNCVGTFLFTKLLTPTLITTARSEPANTVRVVWLSSFGLTQYAHESRGIDMDNLDYHIPKPGIDRYGISKCGNWLLGVEYARRHKNDGIVSVPINPGNLRTALARDQSWLLQFIANLIVYPVINGVYTQLFAGFSPEVTTETDWSAKWVIPWGRFQPLRSDLPKATKPVAEGGNGNAQQFWDWNEEQVKKYL